MIHMLNFELTYMWSPDFDFLLSYHYKVILSNIRNLCLLCFINSQSSGWSRELNCQSLWLPWHCSLAPERSIPVKTSLSPTVRLTEIFSSKISPWAVWRPVRRPARRSRAARRSPSTWDTASCGETTRGPRVPHWAQGTRNTGVSSLRGGADLVPPGGISGLTTTTLHQWTIPAV